jgi:hypothetical protein
MRYYTKVIIKSLTQCKYTEPHDNEKCGVLIKRLYEAIACPANNFGSLTMSVVKHDHRKAVIKFACDNAEEFVAMKKYFSYICQNIFLYETSFIYSCFYCNNDIGSLRGAYYSANTSRR